MKHKCSVSEHPIRLHHAQQGFRKMHAAAVLFVMDAGDMGLAVFRPSSDLSLKYFSQSH